VTNGHEMPRSMNVTAACPVPTCRHPGVRRVSKRGILSVLECNKCKHRWREVRDAAMVRGLIILPAGL
jgi:hypothetical protein